MNDSAVSPNLMGGRLAPQWLYFDFYLLCRRQHEGPGFGLKWLRLRDPTFLAWNSLGAAMALPWLSLLLLLDRYLPFLHNLGELWMAMHLPGSAQHAWGYALIAVGLASGLGFFAILFGGRYTTIMRTFSAYNHSQHTIVPSSILMLSWLLMLWVAVFGLVMLHRGHAAIFIASNLVIWLVFMATEVGFRIWWRWWCKRHPAVG